MVVDRARRRLKGEVGLRDHRHVLGDHRGEVVGEVGAGDRTQVVVVEGIDQSPDVHDVVRNHRNLDRDVVRLLHVGHDGEAYQSLVHHEDRGEEAHRNLEVEGACDDVVEVHQTLVEAYLVRGEVEVEEDRDGWGGDVHVEVGEDTCR